MMPRRAEPADVDEAVRTAADASPSWSRASLSARSKVLFRFQDPSAWPPSHPIGREASVGFSSVYHNDREFAGALRLLARGVIGVAALTTGVISPSGYGEAFASLRDPERAVKIFLDPRLGSDEAVRSSGRREQE